MRFFETELIDQFIILLNRELYIYNYETIQQTKQKSKLLKSLKAYIYITSYMLSDGTVLQYNVFYNELMGSSEERLADFINNIQTMDETTIDDYFYKVIELPNNVYEPEIVPPLGPTLRSQKRQRGGTRKYKNNYFIKKCRINVINLFTKSLLVSSSLSYVILPFSSSICSLIVKGK